MAVYLLSFADSRLKKSSTRLRQQALESKFFDNIFILNENDLDPDFRKKYKEKLSPNIRGYGYWCWKSQIVRQMLSVINENDSLVYIDIGCWINKKAQKRFNEYLEILHDDKLGLIGFQQSLKNTTLDHDGRPVRDYPDYEWTKGDLVEYFGLDYSSEILNTPTIHATIFLCRKTPFVISFFNKLGKVIEDGFHLIDDSPSHFPNHPHFIEHRHDQAAYSLLCKMNEVSTISSFENWYPKKGEVGVDWDKLSEYPLWSKRDLEFNNASFFSRVKNRIKKIILKGFSI